MDLARIKLIAVTKPASRACRPAQTQYVATMAAPPLCEGRTIPIARQHAEEMLTDGLVTFHLHAMESNTMSAKLEQQFSA
jgi:hypothetical protein